MDIDLDTKFSDRLPSKLAALISFKERKSEPPFRFFLGSNDSTILE